MTDATDTTYGRNAQREREIGRKAAASARGDALGELNCEVCGYARYGRDTCRECDAGPEARKVAANDYSGKFPMSLADARKFVAEFGEENR